MIHHRNQDRPNIDGDISTLDGPPDISIAKGTVASRIRVYTGSRSTSASIPRQKSLALERLDTIQQRTKALHDSSEYANPLPTTSSRPRGRVKPVAIGHSRSSYGRRRSPKFALPATRTSSAGILDRKIREEHISRTPVTRQSSTQRSTNSAGIGGRSKMEKIISLPASPPVEGLDPGTVQAKGKVATEATGGQELLTPSLAKETAVKASNHDTNSVSSHRHLEQETNNETLHEGDTDGATEGEILMDSRVRRDFFTLETRPISPGKESPQDEIAGFSDKVDPSNNAAKPANNGEARGPSQNIRNSPGSSIGKCQSVQVQQLLRRDSLSRSQERRKQSIPGTYPPTPQCEYGPLSAQAEIPAPDPPPCEYGSVLTNQKVSGPYVPLCEYGPPSTHFEPAQQTDAQVMVKQNERGEFDIGGLCGSPRQILMDKQTPVDVNIPIESVVTDLYSQGCPPDQSDPDPRLSRKPSLAKRTWWKLSRGHKSSRKQASEKSALEEPPQHTLVHTNSNEPLERSIESVGISAIMANGTMSPSVPNGRTFPTSPKHQQASRTPSALSLKRPQVSPTPSTQSQRPSQAPSRPTPQVMDGTSHLDPPKSLPKESHEAEHGEGDNLKASSTPAPTTNSRGRSSHRVPAHNRRDRQPITIRGFSVVLNFEDHDDLMITAKVPSWRA
ncbi:MAG: hypothetical protein M1827_000923 [Pycnora praestabilis]|nr:MAG: hypothetical protein M1827_000923 [Pycnora praestabilis]